MNTMASKKIIGIGLLVVLMGLAAFAWLAINPMGVKADPGNHAPSGKHYNLQLHGVPDGQDGEGLSEDDKANGGNIWIPLDGKCDIGLREGNFQVTDRSCGFDGDRAEFELPNPDADEDNVLDYSVWIRVTATKNRNSDLTMQTCFTDDDDTSLNFGTWCNTGDFEVRVSKSNKFKNVSKELLQVCVDYTDNSINDPVLSPLFADEFEDYFWHINNNGVRLLQMRFYPLVDGGPTGGDCTRGGHTDHGNSSKK